MTKSLVVIATIAACCSAAYAQVNLPLRGVGSGGGGGGCSSGSQFDPANKDTGITLSTTTCSNDTETSTANGTVLTTTSHPLPGSEKIYFEVTVTGIGGGTQVGIATHAKLSSFPGNYLGQDVEGVGVGQTGTWTQSSGTLSTATACAYSPTVPTTLGIAIDTGNTNIWCTKDGTNWNAGSGANPATNTGGQTISGLLVTPPYYAAVGNFGSGGSAVINTGAHPFTFTIPSGFSAAH